MIHINSIWLITIEINFIEMITLMTLWRHYDDDIGMTGITMIVTIIMYLEITPWRPLKWFELQWMLSEWMSVKWMSLEWMSLEWMSLEWMP